MKMAVYIVFNADVIFLNLCISVLEFYFFIPFENFSFSLGFVKK